MDNPKIDGSLLGRNDKFNVFQNNSIAAQKRKLSRNIVESLYASTETYSVHNSIAAIQKYLENQSVVGRLMYFEITSAVFQDSEDRRTCAMANLERLMEYTYTEEFLKDKEHENKEQYQEIATKIYDHFNLANYQIHEITEKALKLSKEKFKKQTSKELRKAEQNYITILGIFASIVMAAVGSFNYTTAALGALSNPDINYPYVIGMVTVLGVVLVSIMDILTKVVFRMVLTEEGWCSLFIHGGAIVLAGILIAILIR